VSTALRTYSSYAMLLLLLLLLLLLFEQTDGHLL
jgi:hypothetical protein